MITCLKTDNWCSKPIEVQKHFINTAGFGERSEGKNVLDSVSSISSTLLNHFIQTLQGFFVVVVVSSGAVLCWVFLPPRFFFIPAWVFCFGGFFPWHPRGYLGARIFNFVFSTSAPVVVSC